MPISYDGAFPPCICWMEKAVDVLPSLDDASRNNIYILPDDTMWILNYEGNAFIEIGGNHSGGRPTIIKNNDGYLLVEGSGTYSVAINVSENKIIELIDSNGYTTKKDLENAKQESQKNVIDQVIGSQSYTETITIDFTDKISNSIVENSNKLIHSSDVVLLEPTVGSEATQSLYERISTLNGTVGTFSISKPDFMKQVVLQFNILDNLKRRLGETFFIDRGATDIPSQVEVIKQIVKTTVYSVWGYGNGPSGNKLNIKKYSSDQWETDVLESTSNSIVKLSQEIEGIPFITPDGWLYIVAYAEASDGTTASSIYIDYVNIELTIELSANEHIKKIVEESSDSFLKKDDTESGLMVMKNTDIVDQDLNDITEFGFYYLKGASGLNRPTSSDAMWGHMMVISKGSSTVVQQVYDATSGGIDVYVRTKTGVPQKWSNWKSLAFS
ncbi:pyocin knob domain-containing protein [Enterococcus avium]|uniref:pyocin knob domain-containing protein n=1 Tax=Enterococcus avium TaxID=33945 RepID=UPI001F587F14|nr:pyocin knob domain-containing protein [Enterococcus avium]